MYIAPTPPPRRGEGESGPHVIPQWDPLWGSDAITGCLPGDGADGAIGTKMGTSISKALVIAVDQAYNSK